jgi:hypothetical protein
MMPKESKKGYSSNIALSLWERGRISYHHELYANGEYVLLK